jgi:hypothetical protein
MLLLAARMSRVLNPLNAGNVPRQLPRESKAGLIHITEITKAISRSKIANHIDLDPFSIFNFRD